MTTELGRRRGIDVALIVVAVTWGSSYLAAKNLLAVMNVSALLTFRFGLTTLVLGVLWLIRRERVDSRELAVSLGLGALQAMVLGLETFGVEHTSASNAGLIVSLAITFTPVLDGVARRRWLPAPFFIATAVAIVGVGLLLSSHGLHPPNAGDVALLVAALLRSLYVVLMGHLTARRTYSSLFMTFVQSGVVALVFGVVGLRPALHAVTQLTGPQWFDLSYLGVCVGALGFLVLLWAVRATSPSRASLLLGTEPVWAVGAGVVLGHEHLGPLGVAGAVVIIGATYAAQGIEQRHRHALADREEPVRA